MSRRPGQVSLIATCGLSKRLWEALGQRAEREGISRAAVMRAALAAYLRESPKQAGSC